MAVISPCAGGLIDTPEKSLNACTSLVKAQDQAHNPF
jgi:hypothetical protein